MFVYVSIKYTHTSRLVSKLRNFKHFVYCHPYNIISITEMWLLKEFTFDGKLKSNDFRSGSGFREGASIGPANY